MKYQDPMSQFETMGKRWHRLGKVWHSSSWSDRDRSLWRKSDTIILKSELLIGRIYRRFINEKRVTIRFAAFDNKAGAKTVRESIARANDPLYLMFGTSLPGCPPHISDGNPMFMPWGEPSEYKIRFRGTDHVVTIRYSIAKKEARLGDNPGARPHGQHARSNVGVSIMRADCELHPR